MKMLIEFGTHINTGWLPSNPNMLETRTHGIGNGSIFSFVSLRWQSPHQELVLEIHRVNIVSNNKTNPEPISYFSLLSTWATTLYKCQRSEKTERTIISFPEKLKTESQKLFYLPISRVKKIGYGHAHG